MARQRVISSKLPHPRPSAMVVGLLTLAAVSSLRAEVNPNKPRVEPPLITTAHRLALPSTALNTPMRVSATTMNVWRSGSEQRMLLEGNVTVELGYRTLAADTAAIWLTPANDGGENAFDAAVFLSGNVQVREGRGELTAVTAAKELLVTTRISENVQVFKVNPVSKASEDHPVVKRGDKQRQEQRNQPPLVMHIPVIVISDAEYALQAGWIARGPGNRIVLGPGDAPLVSNENLAGPLTPAIPVKPRRPQVFATGDLVEYKKIGNEQVTVVKGGFYLMRTTPDGKAPIELRAQRAVLFSPPSAAAPEGGTATRSVTGVYLEGDVTLENGAQTIKANKIFYDFTTDRAIMIDAVLHGVEEERNVPVYLRADEIRQLSRGEFAAKSAKISISEFYTPHYHIGASDVYLREVTPRDEAGNTLGQTVYAFKMDNPTMYVEGTPIFWWPYLSGTTDRSDIPLRRINGGYGKQYGLLIETKWNLLMLLGQPYDRDQVANINFDYFGSKGFGTGVDARWQSSDGNGLLRSYGMLDHGKDNLGRTRENLEHKDDTRGRVIVRDQRKLSDEWTLQIEGAYVSDPNYLEQYFVNEFNTDKEPETSLYLKRQVKTEALTFLGKWNLYDFMANADLYATQYNTEKSPEIKYYRIGDDLFGLLSYYSESGFANVNHSFSTATPGELALTGLYPGILPGQTFKDYYKTHGWTDSSVMRFDTRHEVSLPLQLGFVKVAPYVGGRLTWWDTAFPETGGNNDGRFLGSAGIRASSQFWRVYDEVDWPLFDVKRLRHIIEPQFNLYTAATSRESSDLQPFDRDVEGISTTSGMEIALHQRFQTKRGRPGNWKNVDWLTVRTSYNYFFNNVKTGPFPTSNSYRGMFMASRPELSLAQESLNNQIRWQMGERTRLELETSYGMETNTLEQYAGTVVFDHTPAISYFISDRYIRIPDTDIWTVGAEYQLSRKYTLQGSFSYDIAKKENVSSEFTIIRELPRMFLALTFSQSWSSLNDTTIMVSLWPEGFNEVGIGSPRRFRQPNPLVP